MSHLDPALQLDPAQQADPAAQASGNTFRNGSGQDSSHQNSSGQVASRHAGPPRPAGPSRPSLGASSPAPATPSCANSPSGPGHGRQSENAHAGQTAHAGHGGHPGQGAHGNATGGTPLAPQAPGQTASLLAVPPLSRSESAWIDHAIRLGDHFETPQGPLPVPLSDPPAGSSSRPLASPFASQLSSRSLPVFPAQSHSRSLSPFPIKSSSQSSQSFPTPSAPAADLALHEKDLLAAVLCGHEDQRERWGTFRRRIGLRYNEPVPESLWSSSIMRLLASEIDAIFRGERDVQEIHGQAIRHGLRERSLAGRWQGDLQQVEEALADLLAWGRSASALDFPIACDLFQAEKARQIFYPALSRLLERRGRDRSIASELQECREALNEAQALAHGRLRQSQPVLSARDTAHQCIALAALPLDQRPKPISTGIPSLDLDMRGGVLPGHGEGTWVLAARSGVGKTTVAIAAAMGLACNGASLLVLSCELTRQAILARLMANYCRRALGIATPLYSTSDLEGRGRHIAGEELERLQHWHARFQAGQQPDGRPMGELFYESRFGATVEEVCELVEDSKAVHPNLSVVVLDHFHAMGASPGYGSNTTAELAARAMALKALAGRCDLDILIVAQLNRGAYGSPSGPDVSHLAGTSELERYASAVWLIDRPKAGDGPPPPKGLLEVHHGKFRHGQPSDLDLSRTVIRLDRAHCFLEADEARLAFCGSHLYPGVAVP